MYPVIEIASVQIPTTSLAEFVAILVLFVGISRRQYLAPVKLPRRRLMFGFMWMVIGALLGAWLAANLPHLVNRLLRRPTSPLSWWEGRHWMGVVSGGSFAGIILYRKLVALGRRLAAAPRAP